FPSTTFFRSDEPWRDVREDFGDPDRSSQERDRERQQTGAGCERRQPQADRKEQRHDEEESSLDEELEEEHGQPARQLPVPQHGRAQERFSAAPAAATS